MRRRPALAATAAVPASATPAGGLNEVLFVGDNREGTADVIESAGDYAKVGRIDVVPDRKERMRGIYLNPIRLAFFRGIRRTVGAATACRRNRCGWSPTGTEATFRPVAKSIAVTWSDPLPETTRCLPSPLTVARYGLETATSGPSSSVARSTTVA